MNLRMRIGKKNYRFEGKKHIVEVYKKLEKGAWGTYNISTCGNAMNCGMGMKDK